MLNATLFERTFLTQLKHVLGSAAVAVEFFKRNVKSKTLFIKALSLSAQVTIIGLRCNIGNTLRTIMTTVTRLPAR